MNRFNKLVAKGGENQEQGSITLLLTGLCALLLLIASVTIAITTVHIERQKLQSLADQASSSVAASVEQADLDATSPEVVMTDTYVRDRLGEFLQSSGAYSEFDGLRIDDATGSAEGTTVEVVISSYVHLPLISVVLPAGIHIQVTGTARGVLEQQ